MQRHRLIAPAVAAALITCAGCFTMTNGKSGKVTSPGITLNLGGTFLESDVAPVMEARVGIIPRLDMGYKVEALCHSIDARLQLLADESNSIDVAVEGGMGLSFIRVFGYAGLAVSKDFGAWNPYCLFRHVDMHGMDREDLEDSESLAEAVLEALLFYVPPELEAFWQIYIGAEIELNGSVALVPEVMIAPDLKDDHDNPLTVFNLGLMFTLH